MPDIVISQPQVASTPSGYTIAGAQDFDLLSVQATFDGSGAGGAFDPTLELINPAGQVMARIPAQTVAAGASAEISWFPGVGSTGSGTGSRTLNVVIDESGAPIQTGVRGDVEIGFACHITEWTLLADQSGSIVVDIWKTAFAGYPPTVANTITGGSPPTLSAAIKAQSSALGAWTTTVSAGDTLRFNVNSASTVTRVTLALELN